MSTSRVNDFQIKNETAALRRRADALLVVVFTPDQAIYSADPHLAPRDALRILRDEASTLADHMAADRRKNGGRK